MSRFLFVLDISFDKGGPSVHLLQDVLRDGLQRGHKIDVILKKTDINGAGMPEEFVQNSNFKFVCIPEGDEKKRSFLSRYLSEIFYAKKCYNLFRDWGKYDAVFLQSNTTAIFYINYLRKLNCPIVFNVQDIFPYNLKYSNQLPFAMITFPIFRKLQHLAYMKADRIITISDDMKQTLITDGVDQIKIDVIYNWSYSDEIIVEANIDATCYYDLKRDKAKFNVVYAGNIGKMQNVELIVKAAALEKNDNAVHYYIIGDGAEKRKIEVLAENLKNVTLLPMQGADLAESIYAQADLNIIPLVEGGIKTALPSKTATCLRVCKPILFAVDSETKVGALLGSVNGVWFANNNPEELIAVIERIRTNKHTPINRSTFVGEYMSHENNPPKYIDALEKETNNRRRKVR